MTDQPDVNESSAPAPDVSTDDSGADADLSRPSRAMQFRAQRRSQVSTAFPALLLIGVGLLYLVKPSELTQPLAIGIGIGVLGLGLVMRFLLNGRRERGLFFVAILILLWLTMAVLGATGAIDLIQGWPLAISAIGVAMIITFVFERTHDRGLLMPGFMLIVAGALALPFTMRVLSSSLLSNVALYWPILFLLAALAILPRAIRDRSG
jgi:hypothetical protein